VWAATIDERKLKFRLAGINNQNFIMRDEETGSWWQQVTGEAILGLLKGRRLDPIFHDELTFATWKRERPQGRVLRPDERVLQAGRYAPPNWEERTAKAPVATNLTDTQMPARTLVAGITVNGRSKAYPMEAILQQSPILDSVGGVPVLVVLGDDKKSVRAFERTVDGRKLEFFLKPDAVPLLLVDAETGSEWDFSGRAIGGALSGRQLQKILVLNDYWFDWKTYHMETEIYKLGEREAK
jgi:Protein of unknown function (DUF3179)